ncbi:PD-(D/E)XK motif protein [Amycolatopsis alba]|uniref:PD-(D/E)XK motif protein n=1 Tax=Amycolatopsis alba DSM 44262 TaxID=1125972 RepID=A0A229RS87_AMYAL|nr:PD-(D/E)XK motif protein [Amycolatopsis alba]OXM49319.1 PD-(D/E)XK motif protein [Amycolatopsis alba DSM 44262]
MTATPNPDRHLAPALLNRVLTEGMPYLKPIEGDPLVWLFVTPSEGHLGLRVHSPESDRAPATGLQHVVSRLTHQDVGRCFEVVVTVPRLFQAAYPLLCSVADHVQIDRLWPEDALKLTLREFAMLLRREEVFPKEREIGLFGELLSLAGLVRAEGVSTALASWRGPAREEHDFGLPADDVEIKTTSGERRTHWVESLNQLVPTGSRSLWLVSHQLTQAGARTGLRLGELVERVRDLVGAGAKRDDLEAGLGSWGWSDDMAERCETRWTRRTPSALYAIDDRFPRLVPESLKNAEVALNRLVEVRYRIDLTGLVPVTAPTSTLIATLGSEEK